MSHFIVRKDLEYQYTRRPTKADPYMSRTIYGQDLGQARVFTTKGAAKNSSMGWGEVVEVELKELQVL